MQRALPVIEQLPRDDALAGAAAALEEFDGHLLVGALVQRQLYEAGGAPGSRKPASMSLIAQLLKPAT
jgi:hypothetical protein